MALPAFGSAHEAFRMGFAAATAKGRPEEVLMPATRLQILTAVVALGLAGSLAAAIPAAAAGPPGPRPANEGPEIQVRGHDGKEALVTTPILPEGTHKSVGVDFDTRRLWSGGAASAVVVGLLALVSVLACRWLFHLPVLAPRRDGTYGDVHTTGFVLGAAAATMAATGLVHLLMLSTPRPLLYFGWIVVLVTMLAVVLPFSTTAPLSAKIATALVNLVIGVMGGALVGGAAGRSIAGTQFPPDGLHPDPQERPTSW